MRDTYEDIVKTWTHRLECQCAPCLRVKEVARRGLRRWMREGRTVGGLKFSPEGITIVPEKPRRP